MAEAPVVSFGPDAVRESVTPHAMGVLIDILKKAGIPSCVITSTSRTPEAQARVMLANLKHYGAEHQKALYGPAGDSVIAVWELGQRMKRPEVAILQRMTEHIRIIGPTNVSHHASDPGMLCVFDVAPSSIGPAMSNKREAFVKAVRSEPRVSKFLQPPADPGYHLEIPAPR